MSAAVKAVVGIVLIVVGVAISPYAPTLSLWLERAGFAMLLTTAASLFIKANHSAPISGISINYTGSLEPRRIIYGRLKLGGLNVLPPLTSGPAHDFTDLALALGAGAETVLPVSRELIGPRGPLRFHRRLPPALLERRRSDLVGPRAHRPARRPGHGRPRWRAAHEGARA